MSLDYQQYLLDKIYERTPVAITDAISALCIEVAPGAQPMLASGNTGPMWVFREWPRVLIEARPHIGHIDDGDMIASDLSDGFSLTIQPIRKPLSHEPCVTAYIDLLGQFDVLCSEGETAGKMTLTGKRVMDITKLSDKIHNAKIDVITWLFETTDPNVPCFCASNKPFKTCCHAALLGSA